MIAAKNIFNQRNLNLVNFLFWFILLGISLLELLSYQVIGGEKMMWDNRLTYLVPKYFIFWLLTYGVYYLYFKTNALKIKQAVVYHVGGAVASSPVIGDGRVIVGDHFGGVHAVGRDTGKRLWHTKVGGPIKSFAELDGDRVFVGSNDQTLYTLNSGDGTVAWKFRTGGVLLGRPLVVGDRLFLGSYDGILYCIDVRTGEELDRFQTTGPIFSSPMVAGDRVYFGNNKGKFYCLRFKESGTS